MVRSFRSTPWSRRKRARTDGDGGVDRLSALPEELLLHILFFLGICDAISTSLLSRRWRNLWRSSYSLNFSNDRNTLPPWFIERALLLHTAPRIDLLRLPIDIDEHEVDFRQIDSMLHFATSRNVRVLDLDFDEEEFDIDDEESGYALPNWIFHCTTLEDLSARNCHLRCLPPSHICLLSLRKLRLRQAHFSDNQLKSLVLGCPVLQSLQLDCCNETRDLVVDARGSKTLEELDVVEGHRSHRTKMAIHAPSVKHLRLHGAVPRSHYVVNELPTLVTASFDFDEYTGEDEEEEEDHPVPRADIRRMLDSLGRLIRQVRALRLCSWSSQILFAKPGAPQFPLVTALELTSDLRDAEMPAIIRAIQACCRLQALDLFLKRVTLFQTGFSEDETAQALCSDIVMNNLKTVTIRGLTIKLDDRRGGRQGIRNEGRGGLEEDDESKERTGKVDENTELTELSDSGAARPQDMDGGGGSDDSDDCIGSDKDDDDDNSVGSNRDDGENADDTNHNNGTVLIGFLLKVSPALERLTVRPSHVMNLMPRKWELLYALSVDLLRLPRASPNAQVIIG